MAENNEGLNGSFGSPVCDGVIKLIQARQELHGKENKSSDELRAIHSNAPWVFLRSGVNIRKSETDTEGTSVLSKECAFYGVVGTRDVPYYRSEDLGVRPLPGITGVNISCKDQYGAILEATVSFEVFSREALEDIDSLYFKPGMPALLEFGHTVYVDENGKIKLAQKSDCLSDEIFFEKNNLLFNEVAEEVRKLRIQNFNYEALFGYVTNFSWSLQANGGYKCEVKMLSTGTVLKGLQLGRVDQWFQISEDKKEDEEATVLGTTIMLDAVDNNHEKAIESDLPNPTWTGNDTLDVQKRPGITFKFGSGANGNGGVYGIKSACNKRKVAKETFNNIEKGGFQEVQVAVIDARVFSGLGQIFRLSSSGRKHKINYITLRDALYILEFLNMGAENTGDSLIKFNKNANYNYVTSRGCFSLNPGIAVKPYSERDSEKDDFFYGCKDIQNGTMTCNSPSKFDSDPCNPSRILNIWVSLEELDSCVRGTVEANTEGYTVYEIVETLLADIQKAFGNINHFGLYRNHILNVWEIVDWNHINQEKNNLPAIRITGTQNTVKSFDIHSDVSDDIANQMSIAAQAASVRDNKLPGSTIQELSHWNGKSISRFKVESSNTQEEVNEVDKEREEKEKSEFWKTCRRIYKALNDEKGGSGGKGETAEERFANAYSQIQVQGEKIFQEYVNEDYEKAHQRKKVTGEMQNGIIPFRTSLTLKGLGGLVIGTAFKLDENVLPRKYKEWGNIVTGVKHSIGPEGWFTTVDTCYYPYDIVSEKETYEHAKTTSSETPEENYETTNSNGGLIMITAAHGTKTEKREENAWSNSVVRLISQKLKPYESKLKEKGWDVQITTGRAGYNSNHVRQQIKKRGAMGVISIVPHWNGGGGRYWSVFRKQGSSNYNVESNKLASFMLAEAKKYDGGGLWNPKQYGIKQLSEMGRGEPNDTWDWGSGENTASGVHCIAVLTENWFADYQNPKMSPNAGGRKWLESREGMDTVASVHVNGLLKYLGIV